MEPLRAVHVHVHGVRVGELVLLNDALQEFIFRYDAAWLADPARPTLGQLFEDSRPGPLRTSGLPAWFAHLLPGGVWKRHLKRWARLHVDAEEADDDFTLLALLGLDLPGALTLEPARRNLAGDSLPAAPLEIPDDALRFSLAGVQWKLSVKRGERGLTVPGVGEAGRYIAKFEDPDHPGIPRVEWATTEWARRAGIATHRAELTPLSSFQGLPEGIPQADGDFLLLERFDRTPTERVHMEDMAQVMSRRPDQLYTGRYEELAALIAALCPEDAGRFIDQLVFMLASGNGDAHLKNWSLLYPDRRTPRLSPAYDLVSTVVYNPRDGMALSLAGTKRFEELRWASLEGLAPLLGWSPQQVQHRARAAWSRALEVWDQERTQLPWTARERERLDAHLAMLRSALD